MQSVPLQRAGTFAEIGLGRLENFGRLRKTASALLPAIARQFPPDAHSISGEM